MDDIKAQAFTEKAPEAVFYTSLVLNVEPFEIIESDSELDEDEANETHETNEKISRICK